MNERTGGTNTDSQATTTESLIRRVGEALDEGRLPQRVYNDPDIHQRELERVFGRSWVFVGHESEVEAPGDYARRYIGDDSFIFTKAEDGDLHVLFDSCRHRGTRICRSEQGNTTHFRCPYHGWTYKNDGSLVGVPKQTQAYGDLDKEEWGLISAPRVENYHGFVFASLAEEGPSFEEHLGDFKWYFDILVKLFDDGWEVIGEPHRWEVGANWKVGAENMAGDGYHVDVTHHSIPQIGVHKEDWSWEGERYYEYIGDIDGHATLVGILKQDDAEDAFFGYPTDMRTYASADGLGTDQWRVARDSTIHVGTVFPSFSYIHQTLAPSEGDESTPFFVIRSWQPTAPDSTVLWSWVLAPKEATAEFKERVYRASLVESGPTGYYEQDDTRVWDGISQSADSQVVTQLDADLNYQAGMPMVADIEVDEDWPGPGFASRDVNEEYARTFHRHWMETMKP